MLSRGRHPVFHGSPTSSSHYLMGFEPRSGEQDSKFAKIQIESLRRGVYSRLTFIVDDPKRGPTPTY